MDVEYTWILCGGICCQFRLLTWNLFIGHFVHPIGGEGKGKGDERGESLF